ncbi:unnamed protein product [Rotaria magnacalcarata]|uniref:Uncharacterized protein n=2 Tax=Rotaria magnacalcarata TaxID=392030 RepID=A0A816CS39_9BILA|nr:unnamed protein product [Rotaria magnacalcarata]CAF4467895.1 unnamed protein product [Rotaria magnacalcarata]
MLVRDALHASITSDLYSTTKILIFVSTRETLDNQQMQKVKAITETPESSIKLTSIIKYIIDKPNSSITVIISDSILLDGTSFVDSPQICAVYNEKLVCLYCLSEMFSTADKYLKNQQEKTKKTSDQSCISKILPIARKYWFLIDSAFSICMGYIFPNLGKTGGYVLSESAVKYGCMILVFFLSSLTQICSLIVIPFLVYYLKLFLLNKSMNKTLLFGKIKMASASTIISSNVIMTKNTLGNEYAALLNAILGNILDMGISVINALYRNIHQVLTGLLSLPLIIGAIQVVLLENWINNKLKNNTNIQSTNENEVIADELEIINVES